MKRWIIAGLALLLGVLPAHAQKSKAALTTEIQQQFPNNTTGAITPQILRNVTTDIVLSYPGMTVVSPLDPAYGATCNGTGNDTTAFNAALVAANLSVFYIPPGAVCVVDPVTINQATGNVPYLISAYGATIKARAASASPLVTIENPHNVLNGLAVYGAIFDANSLHAYPLKVHGGQFVYLRDIQTINGTSGGLWLNGEPGFGLYSTMVENLRSRGNTGAGVIATSVNNTGNYYIGALRLIGLDSQQNTTYGISVDYASLAIEDSHFEGNTVCGINTDHTIQLDFYGTHTEANNGTACVITSTANSLNVKYKGGRSIGTIQTGLLSSPTMGATWDSSDVAASPIQWWGGVQFTSTGPQIQTGSGLAFGGATPVSGSISAPGSGLSFTTSGNTKWQYQNGVQLGSPTGGDKGTGTLNAASNLLVNGLSVSTAASLSGYASGVFTTGEIGLAGAGGTVALSANTLYAWPLLMNGQATWTTIAVNVTTTGTAANCRLGVFASGTDSLPNTLVVDAGTTAVGTTGNKTVAFSQQLNPGLSYGVAVCDGTVTVQGSSFSNLGASNRWVEAIGNTTFATSGGIDVQLFKAFAYGVLSGATPFGASTRQPGTVPTIALKK